MKYTVLLVVLLVSIISCQKDDSNKLAFEPAPTKEGKNTFGCRVNGVFLFTSGIRNNGLYADKGGTLAGWMSKKDGRIFIAASFKDPNANVRLEFKLPEIGAKAVLSNAPTSGTHHIFSGGSTLPTEYNTYSTDGENLGWVKVTNFDSSVISGTFSMVLANGVGDKTVITDGQFDVTLK